MGRPVELALRLGWYLFKNKISRRARFPLGGRRNNLGASSALAERLAQVVHELTNQYVVAYARPPGLIPPDTTKVSVTSSGMTVRSTAAPPLR